ncbi:MAG TPA: FHA domain-containing protein [Streptosporangiaceae bacterium]|nr:FHA domain-containing protein [Streptosporangiaceae bacterium]
MAAGIAGCWALLIMMTGSLVVGTALLLLLAAIGGICLVALRALGVTRDHPWVQRLATRPWRDGQQVLQLALRHLPEVFVVTPSGALLAPNSIELRLNPRDFGSLSGRMDISLVGASAAEVYEEQVAANGARFAGYGPVHVGVLSDPAVLAGRYQLRQGRPLGAAPEPGFQPAQQPGFQPAPQAAQQPEFQPVPQPAFHPAPQVSPGAPPEPQAAHPGPQPDLHLVAAGPGGGWPFAHDGSTCAAPVSPPAAGRGLLTVAEPVHSAIPLLRLVTGDCVAETRTSGARAGRGAVELTLPEVLTVSREHARFTYADGQWWIANLGKNGLALNGISLVGEHALHDGDSIRWGSSQDAPVSRVEIG